MLPHKTCIVSLLNTYYSLPMVARSMMMSAGAVNVTVGDLFF